MRGAILAANSDPEGGPYTIVLEAGETYRLTRPPYQGSLIVERSTVFIEGNGATIEQTVSSRVFDVRRRADLTIDNATVTGGNPDQGWGGGIANSNGTLTVSNSTVSGNRTALGDGGGIAQETGSTRLVNSVVRDNTSTGTGGGIFVSSGVFAIEGSEIVGNVAERRGGGIYKRPGESSELTVTGSIVSDNVAREGGVAASRCTVMPVRRA